MSKQRRSSQRLQLEPHALLACQLLDSHGFRSLAAGEILDLSERGVGIRLAQSSLVDAACGAKLVLRSTLPGTSWSMRRCAQVANRRDLGTGEEIWGLGWSDEAPQGPNYSNYQRWRFDAYVNQLRQGLGMPFKLDLLALLDRKISEEKSALISWVHGSAEALDALCAESERAKVQPLVRPSRWHEEVFELVDPRRPLQPYQGRVMQRFDGGFVALIAVASLPRRMKGTPLWAFHRALTPGMRRKIDVAATHAWRVCDEVWQVRFVTVQRGSLLGSLEKASPAAQVA